MQLATARAFSVVGGGERREQDGEGRDGERKSESERWRGKRERRDPGSSIDRLLSHPASQLRSRR